MIYLFKVVTSLIDHPDVSAVSFVGSSRVAEIVAKRARSLNKRVSLGNKWFASIYWKFKLFFKSKAFMHV